MSLKTILSQLNFRQRCKRYGLSLWQCPDFVFIIMGIVVIFSALFTYTISFRYIEDPLLIALIVILISWVLLILGYIVTHAVEKLAEATRLKLEFLTIMSHQLRAPFANLRWVIDLLVSGRIGSVPEDQKEYLDILKENSARLEELINKIITVSKIESGRLPLEKKPISLKEIVQKVIHGSKVFAEASNVEIEFHSEDNLPNVVGDESRIREVVENFIDNAIKYTKNKGKVKVSLLKKGNWLYFEVKDSGIGIPKEDQKYIFQKFFRSQTALRRQARGSGLGLFIAKSIILAHKGKIGFSSEEGKGSTFWFTLPISLSKDN
ncbi:HAMP domain-containing histidine kinase [bacterium]|nr:HAMP domain-containing histidine kinase [bacterium]